MTKKLSCQVFGKIDQHITKDWKYHWFGLFLPETCGKFSVVSLAATSMTDHTVSWLVSDRNSVSAESIGWKYRYRCRIFFFRNRNFFFFNFSKNFIYFCFIEEYKFLRTWNWTQIFKIYLKILKIWQQIWFKGLFYDWKNTPYYC